MSAVLELQQSSLGFHTTSTSLNEIHPVPFRQLQQETAKMGGMCYGFSAPASVLQTD